MVLKIRLARFGKRHAPFYNIVVAHARYAYTLYARAQYLLSRIASSTRLDLPYHTALEKRYKEINGILSSNSKLDTQNRTRQQTSRSSRHIRPHSENAYRRQRDGEEVQGHQARYVGYTGCLWVSV